MLFETGHPWVTFKDPCNLRSPQQHVGVVHSSNLCTEITLNTKAGQEIAVCNLGSSQPAGAHHVDGKLDTAKLREDHQHRDAHARQRHRLQLLLGATARNSNLRHRPVGLGIMGFHDALYKLRMPYESDAADRVRRPLDGSDQLLRDQGLAPTSPKSAAPIELQGLAVGPGHPADRFDQASWPRNRGQYLKQDSSVSGTFDWDALRARVKTVGMRNSNTMAIAPTATIANITGVSQSIEPTYQNLYVKSNLSGEFTVINQYLVNDLKKLGLWDEVMVHDLKYYDGSGAEDRPHAARAQGRSTSAPSRSTPSGWSTPAAAARSGSTRRSR